MLLETVRAGSPVENELAEAPALAKISAQTIKRRSLALLVRKKTSSIYNINYSCCSYWWTCSNSSNFGREV